MLRQVAVTDSRRLEIAWEVGHKPPPPSMTLLSLFSKRDKQPKQPKQPNSSKASTSEADSTEDYVLPNAARTPALPNGPYSSPVATSASSSKLRLGFSRKKSTYHVQVDDGSPLPPPPFPYSPSAKSEPDHESLRPPLSKSALFSSYGDSPSALSTRSLPTQPSHSRKNSRDLSSVDSQSVPDASPNPGKKPAGKSAGKSGGLFSWHRERNKSKAAEPPPEPEVDLSSSSFNLKSFRHIGADHPSNDIPRPPSALSSPFNTPPLRPRGNSVASDSSQRISVAAFREMAARRNNSPSPSLRPPSRTDLSRLDTSPRLRPNMPSKKSPMRSSSALALSIDSTSEESSDSSESESEDSAGSATLRPGRNKTIRQRAASKATSELGHKVVPSAAPPMRAAKSTIGHGEGGSSSQASPTARVQRTPSIYSRARASVSTSALQPNAAARRASMRAAAKVPMPVPPRRSTVAHISDSSDSDDSDDDAPLSQLLNPRRPGSAASNATSGSRPRIPGKPLIDINSMSIPALPSSSLKDSAPPAPPEKPRPSMSDKPSLTDRLARIAQSAATKSPENECRPPSPANRRSLDHLRDTSPDKGKEKTLQTPVRSQTAPMGGFETPPLAAETRLKSNGRSMSMSSPNAAVVDLTDIKPIVPTPIRERSPPPAFSVTSRPSSQVSPSSSPTLPAHPTVRVVGESSSVISSITASVSTVDRVPSPASTSPSLQDSPRTGPTLRNPPPRTSSRAASVLIPNNGYSPTDGFTGGGLLASAASSIEGASGVKSRPPASRQRSSTMFNMTGSKGMLDSPTRLPEPYSRSSSATLISAIPSPSSGLPPPKPFAESHGRGNSPSSSTGDSSSGRTPLTPADGSEVGYGRKDKPWDSSLSTVSGTNNTTSILVGKRGHRKSSSVTFDETERDRGRSTGRDRSTKEDAADEEQKRKERRRSEAKAAVELGNIVNGRGPVLDDDDDDIPLNNVGPRMSMMNPMMTFTPPSPMPWSPQGSMVPQVPGGPGLMFPTPPPNADPAFLAAHQHAMMVAKQAYQFAVAQQAMAQANEEWERGSNATSVYGGPGFPNMGMGGMFANPYGMAMQPAWTGSMFFPNSAQSMYAGSVAGSELGVNWGSRSVYGGPGDRSSRMAGDRPGAFSSNRSESFGPTSSTSPTQGLRPGPRPRTKTAPSDSQVPTIHARSRQAPPPSSWKTGGGRGV
ncbi:hypothetical protein K474DRAFT_1703150 [Panus rudis PR-1116 ss-1]|nr:hypothetical protein K474DRAFT_1703150 [Panus rudis PR-1116 ss-1]